MPGVRDLHLLKAAVARPQQLFAYQQPIPTLPQLAAAYGYCLSRNHAFVDGNKRSALVALRLFLSLNGQTLVAPPEEKFTMIRALAAGVTTEPELAAWIERRSMP